MKCAVEDKYLSLDGHTPYPKSSRLAQHRYHPRRGRSRREECDITALAIEEKREGGVIEEISTTFEPQLFEINLVKLK